MHLPTRRQPAAGQPVSTIGHRDLAFTRVEGLIEWLLETKLVVADGNLSTESLPLSKLCEQLVVCGSKGAAGIGTYPVAFNMHYLRVTKLPMLRKLVLRNIGLPPSGKGEWLGAIYKAAPNLTYLELCSDRLSGYNLDDPDEISIVDYEVNRSITCAPFKQLQQLVIKQLSVAQQAGVVSASMQLPAGMLVRVLRKKSDKEKKKETEIVPRMPQLTHLTLSVVPPQLAQQLRWLSNLQELRCSLLPNTTASDLGGLQWLPLTSISFSHAYDVAFTASVLCGCTRLQQLNLHDCAAVEPAALHGLSRLVHLSLTDVPFVTVPSSSAPEIEEPGSVALLGFLASQTQLTFLQLREASPQTVQGRMAQRRAAYVTACLPVAQAPHPRAGFNYLAPSSAYASLRDCASLQHLQLTLTVTPRATSSVYWREMFGCTQGGNTLPHLAVLELAVLGPQHAAGLDPAYGFSHEGEGDRGSVWALAACCPALRRLTLTGVLQAADNLEALAQKLPQLTSLCASGIGDSAISNIAGLTQLLELRLRRPHTVSCQALAHLTCLTRLQVLEVNANIAGTFKNFTLQTKVCAGCCEVLLALLNACVVRSTDLQQ